MAKIPPSDSELTPKIIAGDQAAFVTLVERHQAMVSGVTLSILRDIPASEDAAQETFLIAWKKIHTLRDSSKLKPWLATIARNSALSHLRMKKNKPASRALDETLSDTNASPDQIATEKEELSLVLATLDSLPEKYRTPLVLYYREEQSVAAVSEALGLSQDAIKQRLKRGRDELRNQLESTLARTLIRTAPTALFTTSVITALSALAPPAASAASTAASFSHSSVTTSASAASPSLATGAVMNSSKISLSLAALLGVAAIPAGYGLRQLISLNNPNAHLTATIPSPSTSSTLRRDSIIIPPSLVAEEWKRLQEKHGTSPSAMESIYQEIEEQSDGFVKEGLLATLVAEWVELAPLVGFNFFRDQKNEALRTALVQEWLRQDSSEAITAIPTIQKKWGHYFSDAAILLAEKEPRFFLENFKEVARSSDPASSKISCEILAKHDHGALRQVAEKGLTEGRWTIFKNALGAAVLTWAEEDGPSAFQWAIEHKGEGKERAQAAALAGWAKTNPRTALNKIAEMRNLIEGYPNDQHYFNSEVVPAAAKANLDETLAWFSQNTSATDRFINGLMESHIEEELSRNPVALLENLESRGLLEQFAPVFKGIHPVRDFSSRWQEVATWLRDRPEDPVQRALALVYAQSLAHHNPSAAIELVDSLANPEQRLSLRKQIADKIMDSPSLDELDRYSALYPEWSEEFTLAAFKQLNASNRHREQAPLDMEAWISTAEELTDESFSRVTPSFSQKLFQQDPLSALQWLDSIPEERLSQENKTQAITNNYYQWFRNDEPAATQWLRDKNESPYYSSCATTALTLLSDRGEPLDTVWPWFKSLDTPRSRKQVISSLSSNYRGSNSEDLRQKIDLLDIPLEEKTSYLEILSKTP